jgi:surfeit locus 1 family protein
MKLKFQPMPVLTGIVAVMLAILISLGVWQYQRLQWKTDLLAEVEASVTAPPLKSLDDLERAIEAGEPVDFRRIELTGVIGGEYAEYHVFKSQAGGIFWDVFRPFQSAKSRKIRVIFVRTQTIEDTQKTNDSFERIIKWELEPVFGYVREDHPMGRVEAWVKSKPNRKANRWFKFNQDGNWGEALSPSTIRSHYVELDLNAESAEDLPVRRPTIRNNHRDYMLTWFSFAGLLLIFYFLIHKRAGRLSW